MAVNGTIISVMADTTQAENKIKSLGDLLDKMEKEAQIKPELNIDTKSIKQMQKYVKGAFSGLNLDKVFSDISGTPLDKINQKLDTYISRFEILSQAVKPEDISKLAAASDTEILSLFKHITSNTNPTGKPLQNRLQELYNKYQTEIGTGTGNGSGGDGDGLGFSDKDLQQINNTLTSINQNVQLITNSIQGASGGLENAVSQTEKLGQNIDYAAEAQKLLVEGQTEFNNLKSQDPNAKYMMSLKESYDYLKEIQERLNQDSQLDLSLAEGKKFAAAYFSMRHWDNNLFNDELFSKFGFSSDLKDLFKKWRPLGNGIKIDGIPINQAFFDLFNNADNNLLESGKKQLFGIDPNIFKEMFPTEDIKDGAIVAINELKDAVDNATSSIDLTAETQQFQDLKQSVDNVTQSIKDKTQALLDEAATMQQVSDAEIKEIEKVNNKILERQNLDYSMIGLQTDKNGKLMQLYRGVNGISGGLGVSTGYKTLYSSTDFETAKGYMEYGGAKTGKIHAFNFKTKNPFEVDAHGNNYTKIGSGYYGDEIWKSDKAKNQAVNLRSQILDLISELRNEGIDGLNFKEQKGSIGKYIIGEGYQELSQINIDEQFGDISDNVRQMLNSLKEKSQQLNALLKTDPFPHGFHSTDDLDKWLAKQSFFDAVIVSNVEDKYLSSSPGGIGTDVLLKYPSQQIVNTHTVGSKTGDFFDEKKIKKQRKQSLKHEDELLKAIPVDEEDEDNKEIQSEVSELRENKENIEQKIDKIKNWIFNQIQSVNKIFKNTGLEFYFDSSENDVLAVNSDYGDILDFDEDLIQQISNIDALTEGEVDKVKDLKGASIDLKTAMFKKRNLGYINESKAAISSQVAANSFSIEEAHDLLQAYLTQLNDYYKDTPYEFEILLGDDGIPSNIGIYDDALEYGHTLDFANVELEGGMIQSILPNMPEDTKVLLSKTLQYCEMLKQLHQLNQNQASSLGQVVTNETTQLKDLEKELTNEDSVELEKEEFTISDSVKKSPEYAQQQLNALKTFLQNVIQYQKDMIDLFHANSIDLDFEDLLRFHEEDNLNPDNFTTKGHNISGGFTNKGGFIGEDYSFVKRAMHYLPKSQDLMQKQQKALEYSPNANIGAIVDQVINEVDDTFFEIQKTMPGFGVGTKEGAEAIKKHATPEQFKKFFQDIKTIAANGLYVDKDGESNILYDIEKGFSFIDLGSFANSHNTNKPDRITEYILDQMKSVANSLTSKEEEDVSIRILEGLEDALSSIPEIDLDYVPIGDDEHDIAFFDFADELKDLYGKALQEKKEKEYEGYDSSTKDIEKKLEDKPIIAEPEVKLEPKVSVEEVEPEAVEATEEELNHLFGKDKPITTTVPVDIKPEIEINSETSDTVDKLKDNILSSFSTLMKKKNMSVKTADEFFSDHVPGAKGIIEAEKDAKPKETTIDVTPEIEVKPDKVKTDAIDTSTMLETIMDKMDAEMAKAEGEVVAVHPTVTIAPTVEDNEKIKVDDYIDEDSFEDEEYEKEIEALADTVKKAEESVHGSLSSLNEESNAGEKLAETFTEAAKAKEQFAEANKQVANSGQVSSVILNDEQKAVNGVLMTLSTEQFDKMQQAYQNAQDKAEAKNKAKKEEQIKKAQLNKDDLSLATQYKQYSSDYKEFFNAKSIDQQMVALEHLSQTVQRIQELRKQLVAYGNMNDILQLGNGNVDSNTAVSSMIPDDYQKAAESQLTSLKQIETMRAAFIDKQQASINDFATQLRTINKQVIPEVSSGWGSAQQAEYQKITEGANLATVAVESLNRMITDMRSGQFDFTDQTAVETFMTLKESLPEIISNAQNAGQSLNDSASKGTQSAINELNKIEKKLLTVKENSGDLFVIDGDLQTTLDEIETHLQKIKELKDVLNNSPLSILNTDFSNNLQNYIQQMNGAGKNNGIVGESQGVLKASETSFKKVPQYFTQYGNALKRFFDYLSQGSHSLAEIQTQMAEVQRYADKLSSTTGLDTSKLLNGDLGDKATQAMTDNQETARAKYEMSFQSYLTNLSNQINSAETTLQRVLGTQNFDQALEGFTGEGQRFNDFKIQINDLISSLQKMKEFQQNAKTGGIEFFDEENLQKSQQILQSLMPLLDKDVFKQFSKEASGFKIIDDNTLAEARADMQKFIDQNPALSGERISAIKDYMSQLQSGINNIDYTNAVSGFERVKNAAIEANNVGGTFFSELQTRFKSLGTYLLSFVSFYEVIGVFKQGIGIIHELDDALTEMQKVSDESLASLKEYQKGTFATANEIGTTAAQLQQSTADWMRLGEDLQKASQSAQTANVLFNVSEFDNIDDATTALVAMSAAYEDAEKGIDKMDIVDRLNLIGNNYAIATDELATALQDGAATLTTAGNDLDEAIALTTAGNLITQDASKTGKGIRTIALRLTGTKEAAEELEEMGEDTSDMIMSQSKMRELIMNATKVASNNYQGFDIQDELGRYKSTYEIMLGLSQIWDEIRQADLKSGDNRQNLLLESIAGKNRASIASSILQNPKTLQSVYEDSSTKAANSAMKENQKYLDSISGHLAKLQNAWQEMWANAANRDVINMFIDLGTTILNVINEVGGLQSAFALLYGGTIIKGLMTADSWLVKFVTRLDEAKATSKTLGDVFRTIFDSNKSDDESESIFKGWAQIQDQREKRTKAKDNPEIQASKEQKEAQQEMNDVLEEANGIKEESTKISEEKIAVETAEATVENTNTGANIKGAVSETADATATEKNTEETVKNTAATVADTEAENAQTTSKMTGAASQGMDGGATGLAAFASSPMAWLIAIPAIISAINIGLVMWKKHQQDLIDGAHEATNTWNENKTSLETYTQQYQDLHKQLENTNLSEEEQADIKKQIFDLQKQITDEYGHQVDGINLVNGNLDEQLKKLQQIKRQEASNNLQHHGSEYSNAREQLTEKQRSYSLDTSGVQISDDLYNTLFDGLEGTWERFYNAASAENPIASAGVQFSGTALEAESAMEEMFDRLSKIKDQMGDEWAGSLYETIMNSLVKATAENDAILTKYKDDYIAWQEQSVWADKGVYGDLQLTAGEILVQLEDAVNNYNAALLSGDTSQIEKTKQAYDKLIDAQDEYLKGHQEYSRVFADVTDKLDQTQIEVYNTKKKFDDPKVKNIVESILGTPQENKKSAKEIPDALRDAAENLLDEQRKAYEWGMKPFGVNPLQGLYDQSQFGNIDMNNRPTIKWNDDWKKQFAEALKSWNYNPEEGMIDTVFGGADTFNGLGIAFTPILTTEDGKTDFMSYDAVHEYIQGLVEKATDKDGNIDAQLVLDLDADRKNIIGAIDGIGKYSAATVGKMMHFSGTKGAIYLGMEKLSKAAKDAGVDVNKVLEILQKTGNVDALSNVFDNFKYDVTDIEGYLSNLSNLPPEIANDIQTIADAFGITADSSQESINAVAELLGSLGYIATTSLDEAGESFDKFTQKASGWIEETSNLSSTLSKGQGFLTFTKTQDDQGHEIASEVKAIADAYKDLPGYNYASLFEETAGGIMVNAEALRALQSQEESMRHAEFYEKRQELMEKFTASSGAAAEAYRAQIEELDMLWSAYSGATSALSKYQNGHGSADYSTNYKLFRDQIFKEGDEYLNSGEVGEEGFRRIAQLFSYKDLALASVDEVTEAYQKGADTMQKFFTEDPTQGVNLWQDEIMSWPEEYAKITTNAAGETIMTMTDKNLDAVAKQYGVSKDLILSLMNEMNATGSRIHFFTDGQMQQLEQVNQRAEEARQALVAMRDQGTDPALANSDILNFDMINMSADELKSKIEELQDLRADPNIDTETASLLDELLKNAIESLDIINGKEVKPQIEMDVDGLNYTKEVTEDLNERLKQISEYKQLGYNISITGDDKVREVSQEIASWSEEMQKAYGFEPSVNPEDIAKQIEEKFPNGVELKVAPKLEQEEVDAISNAAPEVKVGADITPAQSGIEELLDDDYKTMTIDADTAPAQTGIEKLLGNNYKPLSLNIDPASEEAAKQEVTDTISSAEPDVGVHAHLASSAEELESLTTLGFNGEADFQMNLSANASQANEVIEETKEEATKETEMPLVLKAENTAQDAANQAGAQQGVQTTNHETTIKDEQINTTVTSDTSQVDAASQTVSSLKAMSGSNISIGLSVDGTEDVEKAKDSIDNLTSQKNPKVKVTINGNSAQFNKTSSDVTNKLNALGKKVTTPKISADNSRLSSKVSDSKSKLSSIKDKTARITASQVGFSTISSWKSSVYDKLSNKTITIKTKYTTEGKPNNGGGFQGSAHNQGTVISKGHAYAGGTLSGDWGLPKAEKGALVNELGSEVIVTPDGHWQILNGGDPTFANLPKGSIIFNHKQSESLLKKGYVNGSHGKMVGGAFASGSVDDEDFDEDELEGKAFAAGTAKWDGQLSGMSHAAGGTLRKASKKSRKGSTSSSSSSKKSSGSGKKSSGKSGKKSSGNSSSNKSSKDNLQTLDAIEIRLNRIDALISQLDTNAAKTYSTFANRNSALVQDLATVQKEINAINSSLSSKSHVYNYLSKASAAAKEAGLKSGDEGYKKGSQGASGTALSDKWIKRIQNSVNSGQYFTINDVKDEGLWKKIQAYQTWYEKYVKMQQKLQDQINKLSQLTIQQLTLIQTKWETTINNIGANITSLQNRIDLVTERGYDVAENYYSSQITENQNKIKALTSEASELQAQLNAAVKAGRIQQYSEEWYKWYIQIKNINNEVIAANKEIQSLVNSIRQLRWDKFERGQDELSNLADEMEFLGDLINEIDLFDKDTGLVTDKGKAAFALEAQRYDIYIKQAKKYGEAVKRLNADIAKDPNNKTLIDQRNEWLKAQQDAISNAHSQKEAIADLVEKGIKKQIEVMEDLIDKYEDALDAEKEQQKYAESIAKKQKEINSLQKQLKAMEGDDSEEGATKRQKLRDQLKEAQKDLEDTQEDQRISDIKDALSTMQEKYEEVLNARLDNIDALLTEVVSGVNQSGADIVSTLKDVASSVDYSLSGSLNNIYTGVQNLSANVANVAGQVGALVTATSTSNGSVDNTSATTYAKTPTPTVPTTPTVADYTPKATTSSSTSSSSTAAKSTTTPAKTTTKNGLITEGGQTYYYKNNKKQTGWQTVGGKKYYFSTKNGAMLKDVQKIGNTYYLLDKTTGALKSTYTGLYKTGSSTYYFKSGAIQTGWRDMKEGRRYFSVNSGKMLTGKQKIGNDEYYFNSNGILQIGKFNVDGYTFETDKNGKIKKRTKATGGNALKGSSNNKNKAVSTAASKGLKIQGGFAKGTKNVNRAGMYRVDEEGQEVFINKNGKIYTRLDKGTAVLPHDAAVNLLKGMSNPADFIASHMDMRPNKNITNTNNTTGDIVNNITFNIPNVTNYKEFMQEAQRDPNFTKYIQELSIGRLNGNNSLKGNSIRFR